MTDKIDEAFKRNVRIMDDGCSIECKKGLWSVYCLDKERAMNEAKHYFIQYFEDGEYKEQPCTFK